MSTVYQSIALTMNFNADLSFMHTVTNDKCFQKSILYCVFKIFLRQGIQLK